MKNSIQTKIALNSVVLVVIALLLLGIGSVAITVVTCMSMVESEMQKVVDVASSRVEWELKAYMNVANDLGANQTLTNPDSTVAEKQAVLDNWTSRYGFERCNLIDSEGIALNGTSYADREYFQAAMQGQSFVSDPLVSKTTGEYTIIISAPLYINRQPAGCVYVVPNEEFLNDIMRTINLSINSVAYMVNNKGDIIAHPNMEEAHSGDGWEISDDDQDPGYEAINDMHAKMVNGETGYTTYSIAGRTVAAAYHPVNSTNGWSMVIQAPVTDFLGQVYTAVVMILVVAVVAIAGATVMSIWTGKRIGRPIKLCTERIDRLARGDLTSPVPEVKLRDETGILAESTATTVHKLNNIINDVGRILSAMASGNFAVNTKECSTFYAGDFRKIIEYMDQIKIELTHTLNDIDISSDQVYTGAEQVAAAATNLSQGTTEQASSVQELAATLRVIAEQVNETSMNCTKAKDRVSESATYVNEAIEEMKYLSVAMNNISNTSDQIGNIIKTIEDIAFQTNILALNAAVEAARAGEAGKGFAVVAEEVRNLASKSADAAKDTTDLIEQSMQAVAEGMTKATATSTALQNVGTKAALAEEIVGKIAEASLTQSASLAQVDIGVEQISVVVQRNAATSEESAASAEELSSQATMLKNMVKEFKLSKV